MKRSYLLVLVFAVGCASLPVKDRIARGLEAIDIALTAAQETSIKLADAAVINADDDAKFHAILGKAFRAEARAATLLIEWRAGDPVPESLNELIAYCSEALTVLQTITDDRIDAVIDSIQIVISHVGALILELRGQ